MTIEVEGVDISSIAPFMLKGQDGVSITSVTIGADGHLRVTLSNDTTVDVGTVAGLVAGGLAASYLQIANGLRSDATQALTYAQQLQMLQNLGSHSLPAPSPSGDFTGATDFTNLQTWLGLLSSGSGITRPTGNYIAGTVAAGPYYINGTLNIRAGMSIRSLSPSGTLIYGVGGTAGTPFIHVYDPNFSLNGYALTSQGGDVSGLVIDGSVAAAGTIGVQRGDILNSRFDVTVQNFGGIAVTGTGGASVSVTVNGRSDTATLTTGSAAVADTSVVIADFGTAVSIPSGNISLPALAGQSSAAPMVAGAVIKGVSFIPTYGSCPAVANATVSGSNSIQIGWVRTDTITLVSGSNKLTTSNAIAADLGMAVFGTGIPVGSVVVAVDPGVALYMGTPSIGVLYKNSGSSGSGGGWCEKNTDRIQTYNCHEHVVYDGSGAFPSFDYNVTDIFVNPEHGQHAIVHRGGANLIGEKASVQGAFHCRGTANPGVGLLQTGTSSFRGQMVWYTELGALTGHQGPVSHFVQDSTSSFGGGGSMLFFNQSSPAVNWQTSKLQTGSLNAGATNAIFSGDFGNVWNTVGTTVSVTARKTSGLQTECAGFASVGASTITLSWQGGNYFKIANLAASTAYTVALNGTPASSIGTQSYKLTVIAQQPSGGSATITGWFTGIKWVGTADPTTPPVLTTTASSWTVFELMTTDGGATWTGKATS